MEGCTTNLLRLIFAQPSHQGRGADKPCQDKQVRVRGGGWRACALSLLRG